MRRQKVRGPTLPGQVMGQHPDKRPAERGVFPPSSKIIEASELAPIGCAVALDVTNRTAGGPIDPNFQSHGPVGQRNLCPETQPFARPIAKTSDQLQNAPHGFVMGHQGGVELVAVVTGHQPRRALPVGWRGFDHGRGPVAVMLLPAGDQSLFEPRPDTFPFGQARGFEAIGIWAAGRWKSRG